MLYLPRDNLTTLAKLHLLEATHDQEPITESHRKAPVYRQWAGRRIPAAAPLTEANLQKNGLDFRRKNDE